MQKSPVELSLYQHILYNINKFGDLNVAGTIFIDNDLEVNLLNREIIKMCSTFYKSDIHF